MRPDGCDKCSWFLSSKDYAASGSRFSGGEMRLVSVVFLMFFVSQVPKTAGEILSTWPIKDIQEEKNITHKIPPEVLCRWALPGAVGLWFNWSCDNINSVNWHQLSIDHGSNCKPGKEFENKVNDTIGGFCSDPMGNDYLLCI